MQQVIIEIDPVGNARVEASGVKGAACQDLTRDIEQALGVTSTDTKTPEYFQQQAAGQPRQQTMGAG